MAEHEKVNKVTCLKPLSQTLITGSLNGKRIKGFTDDIFFHLSSVPRQLSPLLRGILTLLGNPKLLLMCVLIRHFPAPVTGRDRIRVKQDQETESGFSLGGRGGGGRGGMQPPRGTHNLGLESVKDPSHPTVQVRNFMAILDSTFSHPSRPIKNQLQLTQAAGHSTSSSLCPVPLQMPPYLVFLPKQTFETLLSA